MIAQLHQRTRKSGNSLTRWGNGRNSRFAGAPNSVRAHRLVRNIMRETLENSPLPPISGRAPRLYSCARKSRAAPTPTHLCPESEDACRA